MSVVAGKASTRVGKSRAGDNNGFKISAKPAIAYALVFGLFALWLHSLLQPRVFANPGLAAYAPAPATVIRYGMPARLWRSTGRPRCSLPKARQSNRPGQPSKASLNAQLM